MVKPLSVREVKARIKAVLRRSAKPESEQDAKQDNYTFQGPPLNRDAK